MDTSIPSLQSTVDDDEVTLVPVVIDPLELTQQLRDLPPVQQLHHLLEHPHPAEAVATLDPFSLYHLLRTVGERDCTELIHYAADEQVQAIFDLEVWHRDTFHAERFGHWLQLLLEQPDDDNLRRQLSAIDRETFVLWMQEHLVVFVFDEDDEPPHELLELQRDWEDSPDRTYKLVYSDDEDASRLLRTFFKRLYEVDIDLARLLLEAARLELRSPLEEVALEIRSGRLEDLGFIPRQEALALYAFEHPEPLKRRLLKLLEGDAPGVRRAEEAFLLPAAYAAAAQEGTSFLARALRVLARRPGEALSTFDRRLASLTNKALAADAIPPGDLEAVRRTAQRVAGSLSIGLQHAADSDLERAADLLAVAWPHDVFRLGFALTIGLRQQAEQLLAGRDLRTTLSLTQNPLSLLPEAGRLTLDALLQARPEYGDPEVGYSQPFIDLDQLHRTAARVSLLAFQIMAIFGVLRLDRDTIAAVAYGDGILPPVEQITTETILNTCFAHAVLGTDLPEGVALLPLTRDQLANLVAGPLDEARRVLSAIPADPRPVNALEPLDHTLIGRRAIGLLTRDELLNAQVLPIVRTTVRRLLEHLTDQLGELSPEDLRTGEIDPAFLGNVVLIQTGGAA